MIVSWDSLLMWHVCWKSYKKIGFLTKTDEAGNTITDTVDETYKAIDGEQIEWDWVIEVWEGYRIGNDISMWLFSQWSIRVYSIR